MEQGKKKTPNKYYSYKGFHDRVNRLNGEMDKAKTSNQVQRVAIATRQTLKAINSQLENPSNPREDARKLKAAKYKANQILKKAEKNSERVV